MSSFTGPAPDALLRSAEAVQESRRASIVRDLLIADRTDVDLFGQEIRGANRYRFDSRCMDF
jgi:hypothetical protein